MPQLDFREALSTPEEKLSSLPAPNQMRMGGIGGVGGVGAGLGGTGGLGSVGSGLGGLGGLGGHH
jgi:hypothetical protein